MRDVARECRLDPSTIWRVARRKTEPSGSTIVALDTWARRRGMKLDWGHLQHRRRVAEDAR